MDEILKMGFTPGLAPFRVPEALFLHFLKRCDTVSEFKIVSFLQVNGPSTREVIAAETGVKRTTAHDALVRLQIKNVLTRETVPAGKGRPLVIWRLRDK